MAAAAWLLAACSGGRGLPDRPTPEASALWDRLARTSSTTHTLQAESRVSYFGPEGRVRLRAVLVAQRPDRFRIETLSPFEEPIDVMVCDGERLSWLSQGILREGRATAERIGRLLPLPLSPEELVDVLLGGLPSDAQPVAVTPVNDPTAFRLDLRRDARWLRLWVDPDADRVLRLEVASERGAAAIVRADFSEWDVQGSGLPRRIHGVARDAGEKTDLRIRLVSAVLNGEVPEQVFRLDLGPEIPRAPW